LTRMAQAGVNMAYNNLVLTSEDISTSGVLGQCTVYRNSSNAIVERRVTIDIPYWNTLSKADREELMYHELAHCILLRGHTSTSARISGVPDSMMHMYHMGPTLYNAYYAWYLNELFDPYPGTTLTAFNGATFNGGAYASTLASSFSVEQNDELRSEIESAHDNCVHNEVIVD
jgi:hypothetical protein